MKQISNQTKTRNSIAKKTPIDRTASELKKVNEKLIRSESFKTNFLSNIRNEINNPISAILEISKKLQNKATKKTEAILFANLIHSEIFNLDFQFRNIMTSAELEAGILNYFPSSIDIKNLILNIRNSFEHEEIKKELKVKLKYQVVKNNFISDSEKLHQIISNLYSNAIKFSPSKGRIELSVIQSKNKLEIKIKNEGEPISSKNKKIIFDRFKQIEEGSTKNHMGNGLGLSVTQDLLEIINGKIKITASNNKETEFTITIKEFQFNQQPLMMSENGNDLIFDNNFDEIF